MSKGRVLHALPGRLRLKTPQLKEDRRRAGELAAQLELVPGVTGVSANALTGSLVVTYDVEAISERRLIGQIASIIGGPIRSSSSDKFANTPSMVVHEIARTIAKAAVEAAVKRAILALV